MLILRGTSRANRRLQAKPDPLTLIDLIVVGSDARQLLIAPGLDYQPGAIPAGKPVSVGADGGGLHNWRRL